MGWNLFYKNRGTCLIGSHLTPVWGVAEGNLKAGPNLSFECILGSNLMSRKNGQLTYRVVFPEHS